jgi:hypothetical protein
MLQNTVYDLLTITQRLSLNELYAAAHFTELFCAVQEYNWYL